MEKQYAVVRTYSDGTGGWGPAWTVAGTHTTDYGVAVKVAESLEIKPRNRLLGWHFYAARIA